MRAVLWFFSISRPELMIGATGCFLLSRFSGFPLRVRYVSALVFSVAEVLVYASYWPHFFWERLSMAVTPAFGLIFALARIRLTPRYATPAGWFLLLFHGWLYGALILQVTGIKYSGL